MNRKQADIAAGVLVASVLLLGVLTATQMLRADDAMMGQMGSPLLRLLGPILMSLVIASIVGGVYVFVRSRVFTSEVDGAIQTGTGTEPDDPDDTGDRVTAETGDSRPPAPGTQRQILAVLPDDERKILEPVIESPGLTQVKVRDRSGFSRSKVSQTITDLEERGLLYRERQGRTYRVYPADDLDDRV